MSLVTLRAVSFGYGEGPTIDRLSLSVASSEILAVVGPSGCGKTTILKLVAGLLRPDSGEVLVGGHPAGSGSAVGMVFQEPRLLPWRTALDNVLLPLEVPAGNRATARDRAVAALRLAGLHGSDHRYPAELSGGMQQRVAVARALSRDPAVLLLDEPFAALDAPAREQLNMEMLALRARTGKTMLFVTHSLTEAVLMADRIVVLSGPPARLSREIAVGLGSERHVGMQDSAAFTALTATLRDALGQS